MNLKTILLIILAVTLVISAIVAQTLPVDTRKKEMQYSKTFTALRYSPAADTVWERVTLPTRCIEVICLANTGAVAISPDSTYSSTNSAIFRLGPGVPLKLPTYKTTVFYVRRAVSTVKTNLSLLFYRM